jgi:hypothetical protein
MISPRGSSALYTPITYASMVGSRRAICRISYPPYSPPGNRTRRGSTGRGDLKARITSPAEAHHEGITRALVAQFAGRVWRACEGHFSFTSSTPNLTASARSRCTFTSCSQLRRSSRVWQQVPQFTSRGRPLQVTRTGRWHNVHSVSHSRSTHTIPFLFTSSLVGMGCLHPPQHPYTRPGRLLMVLFFRLPP